MLIWATRQKENPWIEKIIILDIAKKIVGGQRRRNKAQIHGGFDS
jgi:hypothetical protein